MSFLSSFIGKWEQWSRRRFLEPEFLLAGLLVVAFFLVLFGNIFGSTFRQAVNRFDGEEAVALVKKQYPYLNDYPKKLDRKSRGPSPTIIYGLRGSGAWHLAFVQGGQTQPILDVLCFEVRSGGLVTLRGEYIPARSEELKNFSLRTCRPAPGAKGATIEIKPVD